MNKILVTGACSEIGIQTIKDLLDEGYYVIASDLYEQSYKFNEIFKDRDNVRYYSLDFYDDNVNEVLQDIFSEHKIETCVIITGKNILKPFFQWNRDSLQEIIELNFIRVTMFIKYLSMLYINNKIKGNIIIISSQHGIVANTDRIPYCVSKSMITQLARCLALELAPYEIRVNTISPTFVETKDNVNLLNLPLFKVEAMEKIPLASYAKPVDISNSIIFLAGKSARMITGHDLVIDGGWTIQ